MFPKTEWGLLCPPHILSPSFSSCPSSSFPSSRGGRGSRGGGGEMGKGFSAKNCMDTRGGREGGRQRGGEREGGLCCCNVAQSVCQRQAHHKISQSVCQSVLRGVAHACASVFMTLGVCVCVRMAWVISSCLSREKSDHTLLKFATLMPIYTQYPWVWCWSGEKMVNVSAFLIESNYIYCLIEYRKRLVYYEV